MFMAYLYVLTNYIWAKPVSNIDDCKWCVILAREIIWNTCIVFQCLTPNLMQEKIWPTAPLYYICTATGWYNCRQTKIPKE